MESKFSHDDYYESEWSMFKWMAKVYRFRVLVPYIGWFVIGLKNGLDKI